MHANYFIGAGIIALRFGFDLRGNTTTGYMELLSPAWTSLVPGESLLLQVKFDNIKNSGWATWTGTALRTAGSHNYPAVYVPFGDPNIFATAATATGLHVSYEGRSVLDAALPGSEQAVIELAHCEKAAEASIPAAPPPPSDPFVGHRRASPPPPADPFVRL
jgi:hypothetical protein